MPVASARDATYRTCDDLYRNILPDSLLHPSSPPQFSSSQVNLFGITFPTSYYPVMPSFGDIDNDGDYDLITTPYEDMGISQYKFLYQQNKGSSTNAIMSLQAQNPFGLSPDTSYAGIIIHSELE